jgi:hypothetical protein
MTFVIIEKNKNSVPSDAAIITAMQQSGGEDIQIEQDGYSKKVSFTGTVNHNTFENNLERVANGKKNSWSFAWSDNLIASPTYSLSTSFSEEDLRRFYTTGTNIVVAKPAAGGVPNVSWIVYRPLKENFISWEEQYGIYASNSDIVNGAYLSQISSTSIPAAIEKLYTLQPDGVLSPPGPGGQSDSYAVVNEYNNLLEKGYMTIGLYQNANVDGQSITKNAVSAAQVVYKSTAVMTPYTTVYLWTQSQVKSNTVVTNVTSEMTKVTFGGGTSTVSLQYDSNTGTFISTKALEAGLSLKHISPMLG